MRTGTPTIATMPFMRYRSAPYTSLGEWCSLPAAHRDKPWHLGGCSKNFLLKNYCEVASEEEYYRLTQAVTIQIPGMLQRHALQMNSVRVAGIFLKEQVRLRPQKYHQRHEVGGSCVRPSPAAGLVRKRQRPAAGRAVLLLEWSEGAQQ